MNKILALQCDVHRLYPHELTDQQTLVLGLNLQMVFFREGPAPTVADIVWVQNWLWEELKSCDVYFFPRDTSKQGVLLTQVPVWDLQPKPQPPLDARAALTKRVESLWTDVGPAAFLWSPTNPNAPLPDQGYVTSIQSSAARIATTPGYSLNLCAVVRIKKTDLPATVVTGGGILDEETLVFLTPHLSWAAPNAKYSPTTKGPSKLDPITGKPQVDGAGDPVRPDNRDMVGWSFDLVTANPGLVPQVIAYVKPIELKSNDTEGRYIRLDKGWVRRELKDAGGAVVTVSDPGDDFSTQLASRIADRWATAKHLIDAVRRYTAIPNFPEYWRLIASSLRDRAGLGLIDTTDGNGLLRYALQLAVPLTSDTWFENLIRDGALRTLQARMVDAEAECNLDAWLVELGNLQQLPQVLREALKEPVNLPNRKITLTWPAGDPGVPFILAAGAAPPPVSIVIYARRDGTAGTVGGELLRIPGVVGSRETEIDGSVNLTFDAYQQLAAVPLPAGFFEAIVSDGAGNSYPSARRFIAPTVADDLAPLVRVGTALGNNSVLSPLVFEGWNTRATRTFSVAASAKTRPWFATVVTKVADNNPTYTVSSEWIGDLRPFDGRTWVVTLGSIAMAAAGTEFTLEFSGPYQPDGEPEAAAAALTLKVESLSGTPNLRLTLALKGTARQQQNSIDVPANYHLRIELGRGNSLTMSAAVFVGHGENPATWLTGAPIVQLTGLAEPKLQRLGLRVLNGTAQITAIAPTLLTAPSSLLSADMLVLRQLWDTSMDPASQLWREAQVPTRDDSNTYRSLAEKLQQYDLVTKLARGQTARLEPVWNKQLPTADPNHRIYLQKKILELLRALPADRFDRTLGDKAKSIYRDFYPEASAHGINDELWNLVLDQFGSAAAIPLPPIFNSASPFQEQAADKMPTPMPHALNLEVDRPGMFADTIADGEDADLLLNLRGFGVLLRQANPAAPVDADPAKYFANQPWQLLTAVDIGVLEATVAANPKLEDYKPDVDFGMLSGDVPLQYQNLTRLTTITYQNRHLAAVSPLTQIAESFEFGDEGLRAQPSPFLRKKPAKLAGPAFDWGVLPTLKFGQLYQVFPFVIGNCGNMPVLLTGNNGHPAQLRTTQIGDAEWDVGAEKAKDQIRSLKYLRRVGIGPVRLDKVEGESAVNGKKIGLPEVPAGVRPLANEWQLQGLTFAQPELRYAYDSVRRQGEIGVEGQKLDNWVVVVPRVFVAGASDDELAQPGINFHLDIGLRSQTDSCVLQVEREAESLKVNGTAVIKLETVEEGEIFGGPLDLCVAFGNNSTGQPSLRLAWRRSDRQEPWYSTESAIFAATAIPGPAWVSITRKPATGLDPEETVTLSVPRFATGTVDLQKFLADDRILDVRPLKAPDRAVVVFKGDAGKALTFGLRPPATDLETWTAWFDMDRIQHGAADIRLATWTFHKSWSVPAPVGAPPNPDSSIDDFAVDYLLIELVPLHIDSVPRTNFPRALEKRLQIPWKVIRRPAGNNLDAVQSLAREFKLQVMSTINASWTDPEIAAAYNDITPRLKEGNPIVIRILEKEIWELRVYPAVREDYFSTTSNMPGAQRFHSAFGESMKWSNGGINYRLFNPWRLVLEGGTEEVVVPTTRTNIKDADDSERQSLLLDSLQPRFTGGVVTVEQVKQHPKTYRYAAQLRLQRQVWRWLGRPTPPFPFDASTTPQLLDSSPLGDLMPADLEAPSLVSLWDAAGFGARSNLDLLEEVRPITVDQRREFLFSEVLSNDHRLLYYRFSQQAISRYAGLYPNPPTLQAAETAGSGQNPWRRLVVPCRFDRDVPRPPIRFITPLTQPEEDNPFGDVPGLLVVMDDAWYAHGGLAEALEGEIVEVADFWDTAGGNAPIKRPEFSPSPTHTGGAWTKQGIGEGADEPPPSNALPMELVGPIGHTFDTDADAPLFNASSFVLRPPAVRGVKLADGSRESLDWYFAKVRFRRLLLPEACDDYRWQTPLQITGEQTTALSLDESRAWVVEAAQASLDFDAVSTELKVTIEALGDVILSLASAATLTVRWVPSVAGALLGELVYETRSAPAKTKMQVDLRVLLQLDARNGDPAAPATQPPRHLIVQVRIRSVSDLASGTRLSTDNPQRVWRNVATLTWDGNDWPSNWTLTATGNVSSTLPAAYPARVSPFTPPNWVQFLPNGELLADLLAALRGARVPTLHWTAGAQPVRWKLLNSDGSDLTGLLPLGEPVETSTNSDIALFRCVMLTELIADVRGQFGQELYLGLFRIPKSSTEMVEVHRSVDAATVGNGRGARPPRKLRLRAIEFEIVNLNGSDFKDRFALSPLDFLFENASATSTSDAWARIVRTSPPVECSESPN
jgi:hypothetical protein